MTDLAKVVFVQPFAGPTSLNTHTISCMQLTDRRIYFTWDNVRRRRDISLFKDDKNILNFLSPELEASSMVEQSDESQGREYLEHGKYHHALKRYHGVSFVSVEGVSVGCIDFALLPES